MVEAFHRESLVQFGGRDGLRDEGLLLSCLARPQNLLGYEPASDVFRLAASYCHGIVKNHPFVDGNKRTGILAAIAFLALNDVQIDFGEPEIVVMIIGLAAGDVTELEIADWFRSSRVQ
jgi:death on curing protein